MSLGRRAVSRGGASRALLALGARDGAPRVRRSSTPSRGGEDLAFACGPEGGIEDDEAELATARGWKAASLGPLVLRTETVAAAVLGAVRIWSGLSWHPIQSLRASLPTWS